ncbi:hypothetical protein B0T14DRAFT_522031, partial [Immersiella caudata]
MTLGHQSGGFYTYHCKNFLTHNCQNWVYVNGAPCAMCCVSIRNLPLASKLVMIGANSVDI